MKSTINHLNTKATHKMIAILLGVWLIYLFMLGMLQAFHLPFGFKVWPMDEDRNWIGFMRDGPGLKMVHLFWQTNDRNPLSAWWWLLASPIIKMSFWGIYWIRKCVDPFLSIVTFLLLDRLGYHRCRTFAFCVALSVLFWNFSSYYVQIIWDFLIALGFNLLTIFFYCRYLDNYRKTGYDLALAMLCYFVAISTYTLQSGALIAIVFLALFRQSVREDDFYKRIRNAILDISFFVAIFVIYNCIWYTVNRNSETFYKADLQGFSKQFAASISKFLYHPSFTKFFHLIQSDWSIWVVSLLFLLLTSFFALIISKSLRHEIDKVNFKVPVNWIIVILLAIALPTVIVESTSQLWYPGTRSLMVQQVWQPLLYLSVLFFIANVFLKKFNQSIIQKYVLSVAVIFCATVGLVGLNYNYHLVKRTQYEMTLVEGLKKLHIPANIDTYFIVKMKDMNDPDMNTISNLISTSAQTMLQREHVFLRVLQVKPKPEFKDYWRVAFGLDQQGVTNAAPVGLKTPIPYSNIWIVFFDGKNVEVPKIVDKNNFTGFQVDWQRDKPIDQSSKL